MITYDKSKHHRLKNKFPGSENIEQNFSQSYQDIFVLSMLNGKRNGFFVEIGAHHPTFINNTFLLERYFQWSGISIDIENFKPIFDMTRQNRFIQSDALQIDYNKLFQENNLPKQIDYLQIDIEPTINTFNCLKRIPFDDYRFSVITYETDYYDTNTEQSIKDEIRKESRNILQEKGYLLVIGDVESDINFPYEDWYVDPNVVPSETIDLIKDFKSENTLPESFLLY